VGLCGLALWWWRRKVPGWPATVLFVLLVSTVLAHSATLAPTGWIGPRWFYLALLFPLAAQFLARGGELKRPPPAGPSWSCSAWPRSPCCSPCSATGC